MFLKQQSTTNKIILAVYDYENISLDKEANSNNKFYALCSKPLIKTTTTRQKGTKTILHLNKNISILNGDGIAVIVSIAFLLLLSIVLYAKAPIQVS